MMKKRLWAVLLIALLLLLPALPASAEEGGTYVGPANGDQGDMDFPDDPTTPVDPDPPTDPEPSDPEDPTPPPEDDPTPPPTDEPPSSEPGSSDPPSSEPGPDDPPSSEPGEDDPPSSEPGEDDPSSSEPEWSGGYDEPPYENGGGSGGGGTIATPKPRRPGATGGTILQPPSSGSPSASPQPGASAQPGASPDPSSTEPNYYTFARVNQRNNSMSIVLFYSGAGCIGVGALGLVTLVVFIIRGRRNAGERDDIFEEIQQAEIRQPMRPRQIPARQPVQRAEQSFTDGYGLEPQPTLHRPEPEVLSMPVNGNMYTEEFETPRQAQPYGRPEYPEEPDRREAAPVAPAQAAMYTEEFVLPEDMAQPPAPQPVMREPAPRPVQPYQPAPQPRPVPPPQKPQGRDESFDTTELLREILYTDEDRPRGQ